MLVPMIPPPMMMIPAVFSTSFPCRLDCVTFEKQIVPDFSPASILKLKGAGSHPREKALNGLERGEWAVVYSCRLAGLARNSANKATNDENLFTQMNTNENRYRAPRNRGFFNSP